MLLEAAGIDLDDKENLRYHGLVLALNIEYTNVDFWDFWLSWHWGPKYKYVIKPERITLASAVSEDFAAWNVHYPQDSFTTLDVSQRYVSMKRGMVIITRVS